MRSGGDTVARGRVARGRACFVPVHAFCHLARICVCRGGGGRDEAGPWCRVMHKGCVECGKAQGCSSFKWSDLWWCWLGVWCGEEHKCSQHTSAHALGQWVALHSMTSALQRVFIVEVPFLRCYHGPAAPQAASALVVTVLAFSQCVHTGSGCRCMATHQLKRFSFCVAALHCFSGLERTVYGAWSSRVAGMQASTLHCKQARKVTAFQNTARMMPGCGFRDVALQCVVSMAPAWCCKYVASMLQVPPALALACLLQLVVPIILCHLHHRIGISEMMCKHAICDLLQA